MKTVEILIRIPKYDYDYILSQGDTRGTPHLAEAICKGIVLPKGHGRLIDADKIVYYRCPDNVLDCPQSYDFNCQHCDFGISTKFRTDAIPAIIEADKEEK